VKIGPSLGPLLQWSLSPSEEKTLEEEIPEIDTPEPMPGTSQPIAIQHIESPQEEIPLPDFINDIEDDLFSDSGNYLEIS
jgi:hypothetical protein